MGTTVKERLEEYLKKNKISARKFYEKAEVANGQIVFCGEKSPLFLCLIYALNIGKR